jgi:hypothetical protein
MSARTDRLVFDVTARARGRSLEPGVKSHLCVDCRERRARFRYRGVVKADADHTLCFRCFRALKNSLRSRNPWVSFGPLNPHRPLRKEMQ